jgi:hypothetical protein
MSNRAEVYVEGEWKQDRYISHFVLRSLNPTNLAKFYGEVYELQELEKPADDPNHYLTDGRVTIIVSRGQSLTTKAQASNRDTWTILVSELRM